MNMVAEPAQGSVGAKPVLVGHVLLDQLARHRCRTLIAVSEGFYYAFRSNVSQPDRIKDDLLRHGNFARGPVAATARWLSAGGFVSVAAVQPLAQANPAALAGLFAGR
jgi:hypothetical protein